VSPSEELPLLLKPAGGGLFTVSSGRSAQLALQRELYGAADAEGVEAAWRTALSSVASARVAILGIPSDCGAGLVRGAAYGPLALRAALLAGDPRFRAWAAAEKVVDVGDVAVIPHLLHDDMVSEQQKTACRAAIYPALTEGQAAGLPVAPLSIAERVVGHLHALNPRLRILLIGGDHSVTWPVIAALGRHRRAGVPWAIVHPDAHTDLLPHRLGVKYCFATWAYHANEVLGRGGRLVQVGIRASRHDRQHWESTLGVKQIWAEEIRARGEAAVLDEIVAHLESIGVRAVYFSNDIDATDAQLAPSTGAAEPGGLSGEFVRALVGRVAQRFTLLGADLVEVAPPIGSAEDSRRTVELGASYLTASLRALLSSPSEGAPS
jgi:arginase family enzyme